jgi:hypothetical protein
LTRRTWKTHLHQVNDEDHSNIDAVSRAVSRLLCSSVQQGFGLWALLRTGRRCQCRGRGTGICAAIDRARISRCRQPRLLYLHVRAPELCGT